MAAMLAATAACGGGGESSGSGNEAASNESAAEPASNESTAGSAAAPAAGGAELKLQPGEYEITTEVMGQKNVNRDCLTEEELKKANGAPVGSDESKNCTYKDVSMSGGRIAGTMSCAEGGRSVTMRMDGTHTRTGYDMNLKAEMAGMSITTKISGKRVGECSAETAGG